MSYTIRPADWSIPRERNMVLKSWIRSNASSALARAIGDKAYYSGHHDLVERLLDRSETHVACSETSRETILGWACAECVIGTEEATGITALHFVYVVEDFRRHGIATELIRSYGGSNEPPERLQYTHRTDALKQFRLPGRWFFNPYKLMVR